MIFFTSDLHFGHENIITHCNRPFSSADEMDSILIENWNKKVRQNDTVYLLGDIAWDKKRVGDYMRQLRGKKILILGNHDKGYEKLPEVQASFELITSFLELRLNSHPITLCHYPLLEWYNSRDYHKTKQSYLIHGHIHNRVAEEYEAFFRLDNAFNAGVDVNGFEPVTLDELIENNLKFKSEIRK